MSSGKSVEKNRPVAMVTGSSSGIGRAIALQLAKEGFDLLVHCNRNVEGANALAAEIADHGRQVKTTQADFGSADHAALDSFVQSCWDWQGRIDVWVNNAGADVLTGEAASWDFPKQLNEVLQVDVVATLLLSREVGKRMVAKEKNDCRRPSIVNIGWDQATNGMAGDSGEMFAASKGAIMAMSKSLAQSLAPAVRVNCVAPGWIKTKWGDDAPKKWQARAQGESLSNRWGIPQDVAEAVSFLAGEKADFISGQVLNVNGGFRFGKDDQS